MDIKKKINYDTYFLKKYTHAYKNIDDDLIITLSDDIIELKNIYMKTWEIINLFFNIVIRNNIQLNKNKYVDKSILIKIFKSFIIYFIKYYFKNN